MLLDGSKRAPALPSCLKGVMAKCSHVFERAPTFSAQIFFWYPSLTRSQHFLSTALSFSVALSKLDAHNWEQMIMGREISGAHAGSVHFRGSFRQEQFLRCRLLFCAQGVNLQILHVTRVMFERTRTQTRTHSHTHIHAAEQSGASRGGGAHTASVRPCVPVCGCVSVCTCCFLSKV